MQRVTDAGGCAHLALDDLLAELLRADHRDPARRHGGDPAARRGGDELHARAAKGIEEEVEQGVRIPLGRGFAGRIAAERRAVIIADVDHADILNPILREKGIRSLLGVPLLVEGNVSACCTSARSPRAVHRRRPRPAPARRRPGRARDRARAAFERERARAGAPSALEAAIQRVTDAALGLPAAGRAAEELLSASARSWTPTRPRSCCSTRARRPASRARPRASRRRSSRACGSRSAAASPAASPPSAAPIIDLRRRPRRHPQPDPAREGHPLAARRAAARRGPRDRRAARRHAHPARLRRRRPRPAPARRRPRRARDRARARCTSSAGVAEALQRRLLPEQLPDVPGSRSRPATCPRPGGEPRRRLVRRLRALRRAHRRGRSATSSGHGVAAAARDGAAAHRAARLRARRPSARRGRRAREPARCWQLGADRR